MFKRAKKQVKNEILSFVDSERQAMRALTSEEKKQALVMIASFPVRSYLLAVIDDLTRQGIYLAPAEQEGAKVFVNVLGGEIQKGIALKKDLNKNK